MGSTPQKPGSSALFGESGLISGTIGGGSLEGEVRHIAEGVIISGVSDHYYFNLDKDQGDDGAICGGEAVVLVDANPESSIRALEQLIQSLSNRVDGSLITLVSKKGEPGKTIERHWIPAGSNIPSLRGVDLHVRNKIEQLLQQVDAPDFAEIDLSESVAPNPEVVFIEHIDPLPRLVIAGAGHIGKALAHIGSLLDFDITVIDDRDELANSENIPEANQLIVGDIGQSMSKLTYGNNCYVLIATRGHQHDAEALRSCISSTAAYIGMIGSSHKVSVMKKRFLDEGWATPELWSRIHTPVGIPIGSKTVQEIAISIAAQLVEVRNQQSKK